VNLQYMLGNAPIHRVILYDLSVDRMEMLLNQDADPLIRNIKGNTALLVALFKGKDDMIKLLQPLSDLFAQNQDGLSAMTVALSSPIEIISWFFTSENINLKDIQGNSVMHLAAGYSNGELPKEKILLLIEKGALLNSRNAQGKTPLHLAVEAFYPHTANLLVNQGANMYLMDNQNYSPLLSAFERGADMTQSFLLEDESIIDLQDNLGNTPLFHAIKENYNNIATLLVNLGSDYDHRNLRGITPLLLTIENGETDLFYLLLDHGADINRGDNKGDGALHYLVRSRNQFNRTLAQALLEYGIQPDLTNDTGMTALHYSTLYKNGPALVFLVESGASVDLSDQQGFTPIFYAVLENDISAYNYLVEQGANIHIRDYQGNSLLHVAIVESLEDDNQDLIRSIIRHGGDIYGTNAQGDSPLSLAVTLGPMILDRMLFSQSVNRLDNQGNSPLHRLLELSDNPQMWGIAVARGANLSLRNSQGKTAYQWGLELGYTEEELTGLRP
jgi:ankyrin repeat protein